MKAAEQEQKGRLWLAYHTALMSRAKTLPPFSELAAARGGGASAERMRAVVKLMAAKGVGTFTNAETAQ